MLRIAVALLCLLLAGCPYAEQSPTPTPQTGCGACPVGTRCDTKSAAPAVLCTPFTPPPGVGAPDAVAQDAATQDAATQDAATQDAAAQDAVLPEN